MEKIIYAIEYENVIVFDYEKNCDAIYLSLYEAKQRKHLIYNYVKQFKCLKKCKFKDFKIVEYRGGDGTE